MLGLSKLACACAAAFGVLWSVAGLVSASDGKLLNLKHPLLAKNPAVYDLAYSYGPRANKTGVGEKQFDLFILAFHKTGTILARSLAQKLFGVINDTTTVSGFQVYGGQTPRAQSFIEHPRTRTILILRDPIKLVESGYLYHKSHPKDSLSTKPLTWTSVEDGLEKETRVEKIWLRHMQALQDVAKGREDTRIIWTDEIGHTDEAFECFVDLVTNFLVGPNRRTETEDGKLLDDEEQLEAVRNAVRELQPSRRTTKVMKHIQSGESHEDINAKLLEMRETSASIRELFESPAYHLDPSTTYPLCGGNTTPV